MNASLLFVGGSVWTAGEPTDALAVVGERIVALGSEARALRGTGTTVIDLAGGTLLPGFRDGHIHPLDGGTESLDCDLVDATDVDDVCRRLAAFAASDPDVPWIRGYGYPPEILPGARGEAHVLDRVVADRPVSLWSSDHHMVWCNSAALRVAGIDATTPSPARGEIVRDTDGRPVGTLLEEAERLLEPHLPAWGTDKEARGFAVGLQRMAAVGLVAGQDAWASPDRLGSYQRVADDGGLTADLDLAFKVEVDSWRQDLGSFVEARREAERASARRLADGVPGGRLTATTAKFFLDGVIEAGTGALLDPYEPGWGAGEPCADGRHRGLSFWPREEVIEAAVALDAAGFQLHCHAIGDGAVRQALDTVQALAGRNGPRDRRPVVAHTHLVHPDDLGRFATLGVIANFEPLWAQTNRIVEELTDPRLGAERRWWQYPIGSVLRSGARVSFGSDWPVSSPAPLEGIAVAVTRQTEDRLPPGGWLARERISLDDAIDAYTVGSAHQLGQDEAGLLEVGAPADVVAVGADVRRTDVHDLGAAPLLGTWLRGRRVWGEQG